VLQNGEWVDQGKTTYFDGHCGAPLWDANERRKTKDERSLTLVIRHSSFVIYR